MHGQAPYCRMLPHVHRRTNETFTVDEVVQREGQVRGLLQGPLWPVERLHVPFSEPDKISGQKIPVEIKNCFNNYLSWLSTTGRDWFLAAKS